MKKTMQTVQNSQDVDKAYEKLSNDPIPRFEKKLVSILTRL